MSECIKIEAVHIREGDLIRVERPGGKPGSGTGPVAVEYIARRYGDYYWEPGEGVSHYLLDRPVVLPTRRYSLVVPPHESAAKLRAFILEPMPDGGAAWFRRENLVPGPEVQRAIKRGWRVIEGPEETANGDTE